MRWEHLLDIARDLASRAGKPRQADLKRSVSTAYYAMFHALAWESADQITGRNRPAGDRAWPQVYRSIDHRQAKTACHDARREGFPAGIVEFSDIFEAMQAKRHSADYDPYAKFSRADVLVLFGECEKAINEYFSEPSEDRLNFGVFVLFRRRQRLLLKCPALALPISSGC